MNSVKTLRLLMLTLLVAITNCSPKDKQSNSNNIQPASANAETANAESFDFRSTNWGMNRDQVKAAESTDPILTETDLMVFSASVRSSKFILEGQCGYYFVDNKLAIGVYRFRDLHSNKNDYIEDFTNLKSVLTDKYGAPTFDNIKWKDNMFKKNPEDWGLAISSGQLEYRTKWETDRTNIQLLLYGEKYEIELMVRYDSKEFRPLYDEAEKKKGSRDF